MSPLRTRASRMRLPLGRIRVGGGGGSTPVGPSSSVQPYGIHAYVGPFGAGKTLLALHHAYPYRGRPCAGLCGVRGCPETWDVFTNLPSTWSWAKPLHVAGQFLGSTENVPDHAVILLDEGYQYIDTQNQMSGAQRALTNRLMQVRHKTLKVLISAQSFDFVARRIRGQAARTYNCWNPDQEGHRVYAAVYTGAVGWMPPWMRSSGMVYDGIRVWQTTSSRHLYDTRKDLADARGEMRKPAADKRRAFTDPNGNVFFPTVSELVETALAQRVQQGKRRFSPTDLARDIQSAGTAITAAEVEAILLTAGFETGPDGALLL